MDENDFVTQITDAIKGVDDKDASSIVDGVLTNLKEPLVIFLLGNAPLLIRLGKQEVLNFFTLLDAGKKQEAFDALSKSMNADEIIAMIQMNNDALLTYQKNKEAFIKGVKSFLLNDVAPALIKAALSALI